VAWPIRAFRAAGAGAPGGRVGGPPPSALLLPRVAVAAGTARAEAGLNTLGLAGGALGWSGLGPTGQGPAEG
jgi:hypothetical protein